MGQFANPAASEITGYSSDELMDKPFKDLLHPDDVDKVMRGYISRGGNAQRIKYETRFMHKSGNARWAEVNGSWIEWDGKPATLMFVNDVTSKKEAQNALYHSQEEIAIRNSVSNIFLALEIDEGAAEVLQLAMDITGSPSGAMGTMDENGDMVFRAASPGSGEEAERGDRVVIPKTNWIGLWKSLLVEKKSCRRNEPLDVPCWRSGMQRAAAAPILHEGEVVGALVVGDKNCGYTDKDMSALETIVYKAATILPAQLAREREEKERVKAEGALKTSEEYYRNIIEKGSEVVLIVDEDGAISYSTPSFKKTLGREVEEIVGKDSFEFIEGFVHPDDVERVAGIFMDCIENPGSDRMLECRYKHSDGTWHYLEATGTNKLLDPVIKGVILNIRDITGLVDRVGVVFCPHVIRTTGQGAGCEIRSTGNRYNQSITAIGRVMDRMADIILRELSRGIEKVGCCGSGSSGTGRHVLRWRVQ